MGGKESSFSSNEEGGEGRRSPTMGEKGGESQVFAKGKGLGERCGQGSRREEVNFRGREFMAPVARLEGMGKKENMPLIVRVGGRRKGSARSGIDISVAKQEKEKKPHTEGEKGGSRPETWLLRSLDGGMSRDVHKRRRLHIYCWGGEVWMWEREGWGQEKNLRVQGSTRKEEGKGFFRVRRGLEQGRKKMGTFFEGMDVNLNHIKLFFGGKQVRVEERQSVLDWPTGRKGTLRARPKTGKGREPWQKGRVYFFIGLRRSLLEVHGEGGFESNKKDGLSSSS